MAGRARAGKIDPLAGPSGSSSLGRARPCQGRGSGFEARLPLQYQLLKKRSPSFARNSHDVKRAFSQSLCLELLENSSDRRDRWPESAVSQADVRSKLASEHPGIALRSGRVHSGPVSAGHMASVVAQGPSLLRVSLGKLLSRGLRLHEMVFETGCRWVRKRVTTVHI